MPFRPPAIDISPAGPHNNIVLFPAAPSKAARARRSKAAAAASGHRGKGTGSKNRKECGRLFFCLRKAMNIKKLTTCSVIAAAYAALSLLLAPLSYGNIQIRLSEALTVLPFVAPYTTGGLFVGCLLANLLSPAGINPLDVVFGSLATLSAGLVTARCKNRWLAPLPPVLINAVVVGAVLACTTAPGAFWPTFALFSLEVGAGQLAACYIGGFLLLRVLESSGLADRLRRQ